MKIIYVANTDWYLYNFRLSLMKEMLGRSWQIVAISPKSSYALKLAREGVRFYPIKMDRKGKNPLRDLQLTWELFRLYKKERPDIVHHFTIKPVIYGSFAAKFFPSIFVVNAVTGLGYIFKQKGVIRKFVEILYRFALAGKSYTVFQNPENLSYFLKNKIVSEGKACLIRGSGVDIRRFAPSENSTTSISNKVTFLMASRLLWDKGVKEFVEAAKKVKEVFTETDFWLVGDIDEGNPSSVSRDWLHEEIRYGIIKWYGHRDDVITFIQKADVVVLPSFYPEGLPKILLEGAAVAKPIIATDVPGCREIVENRENGLLVPVKDVSKLAEAMIRMIQNPSMRREMGKKGRVIVVQNFSDEIVISETLDVYKRLGFSV